MGNLMLSGVVKFGIFFGLLVVVAFVATALLIVMDPSKNIDDKDELEKFYRKFVSKARRAFGKKESRTLEKIFQDQCDTARKYLAKSKDLLSQNSWYNGRGATCREFERSFLGYARELANMDIVIKPEVMEKLEKGQQILRNFEHYLSIFSMEAKVDWPHPLGASGAHFYVKI